MTNITISTNVSDEFKEKRGSFHTYPYIYVTILLKGESEEIDISDRIISVSNIDRGSEVEPDTVSEIRTGDGNIVVANDDGYFSPSNINSLFYNKDYYDSEVRIYAGFYIDEDNVEVTSQSVFLIERIELDDTNATATIYGRGKCKKALEKRLGEPNEEGVREPLAFMGQWKFKDIVEYILENEVGLNSNEYDIEDIQVFYQDITFSDVTANSALAYLCESANARMWEDRFGRVVVKEIAPEFTYNDDVLNLYNYINQLNWDVDLERLVNKIRVHYRGDLYYMIDNTSTMESGRYVIIENKYVEQYEYARDIASKIETKYGNRDFIQNMTIKCDWLPDIDINDPVIVIGETLGLSYTKVRVNRLVHDFGDFRTTLFVESYDIGNVTWGFLGSSEDEGDSLSPQATDYDSATDNDKLFAYWGSDSTTDGPQYYCY